MWEEEEGTPLPLVGGMDAACVRATVAAIR
jgi:hypothetical protein